VITRIEEKLFPLTDHCEKRDQLPQLCFIEMTELFTVNLVNPVLDLIEQVQSAPGNPGDHITPVVAAPLPNDQFRIFEAIKKSRDVRHLPVGSDPRRIRRTLYCVAVIRCGFSALSKACSRSAAVRWMLR
jgi:hypothetical protein